MGWVSTGGRSFSSSHLLLWGWNLKENELKCILENNILLGLGSRNTEWHNQYWVFFLYLKIFPAIDPVWHQHGSSQLFSSCASRLAFDPGAGMCIKHGATSRWPPGQKCLQLYVRIIQWMQASNSDAWFTCWVCAKYPHWFDWEPWGLAEEPASPEEEGSFKKGLLIDEGSPVVWQAH